MRFDKYDLPKELQQSILALGYHRTTDIQYKAIPSIMDGEDVMAIAQTGTGKTAAFAIPVLAKLLQVPRKHDTVRALVMVPTRELALQIHQSFQQLAQFTDLNIQALIGGREDHALLENTKEASTNDVIDVLIATPGRMFDMIYQKKIKITHAEILVLDESDQMLALGFYKDILDAKKFLPKIHQTLFFSATITPEIKDLAYSLVKNPIRIQISPTQIVSKNVAHAVAMIGMDDKRFFLERLIKEREIQRMIVFVRTKVRAERVFQAMARVNIEAITLHGDKTQEEREDALTLFKTKKVPMLITTDVAARGIHIEGVEYVINYDLPDQSENYVHRVGRTGRGMEKGHAISFCSPEEIPLLKDIEAFLGQEIFKMHIDKDDYQETLQFSEDTTESLKDLMQQIGALEEKQKKKGKKRSNP